jgi:hypothetical protein
VINSSSAITHIQSKESTRFFEHGQITVAWCDETVSQLALRITAPHCLVHTVTPILLGAGTVDLYQIMNPISVWIPQLSPERFVDPSRSLRMNAEIRDACSRILTLFRDAGKQLIDQSDIIPSLPLGVYVTFRLRGWTKPIQEASIKLASMHIVGVYEFRTALNAAIDEAIMNSGHVLA